MIQCVDCEHYKNDTLNCDPSTNIKEPECLVKWTLLKLMNIERLLLVNEERTSSLMPTFRRMAADREEGDGWKRGTDEEES